MCQKSRSGYIFKGNDTRILTKCLSYPIHCTIQNSPDIHFNIYFTGNRTLALKVEKTPVICYVTGGFTGHHTCSNKLDARRQIMHDIYR